MLPMLTTPRRGPGRSPSAQDRRKRRRAFLPTSISPLEIRTLMTVGGGFAAGGIVGQYYNNTTLSGTPSFARDDVRVDFNWGTTQAPGGSTDAAFGAIGTQNYSVAWTGQVIPQFGESYKFQATSDGGARLYIKPTGSTAWTTLVDDWTPHRTKTDVAAFSMTAGASYDLRLEYVHTTDAAVMQLAWSSTSTPRAVIDPVTQVGINNPDWTAAFTDLVKGGRNTWAPPIRGGSSPAVDSNGWPTGDGQYVFQESLNEGLGIDPLMVGTVTFQFKGSADISLFGNLKWKSLTYTYDATTNTTTGSFNTVDLNKNASVFIFNNSHRDGQPDGPGGITDLVLSRPEAPGASTSYGTGTLFTPQIIQAMDHFSLIRFQEVADQEMNWSDRTMPGYFNQSGGAFTAPQQGNGPTKHNGASWEDKIMLANEAGRDIMISIPPSANNDYISKLANLIRYGSDGVNPYTSPRANPVYPPLNPNLRVYFEIGNELWNWAQPYYTDFANINSLVAAHAAANDADFQALNYDGQSTAKDATGNYVSMGLWRSREIMLRVIEISNIFRTAFGDSAMMTRIRPLDEWQYNNANYTAQRSLSFADDYFNNADGVAHVATPHPVNYYIWGGGGATYYSAANPDGLTTLVSDGGFDSVAMAPGYNPSPSGTIWAFGGTAGIARVTSTSADIPPANDGTQVGYIADQGSISTTFTVPTNQVSNTYAVDFKAVNRLENGVADQETLRVFLDGVDITSRTFSQARGDTPSGYDQANPWMAHNVSWMWSRYFSSKTFTAAPGSTHTLTIRGMGDVLDSTIVNQVAFVEDVQVTSLDALFAGGIPGGGEAAGQPAGQKYQQALIGEANWAAAYGINDLSYEGGWSLGGDDGGSPLQNAAKYNDPRAATVQEHALDLFAQAGGAISVLGTYAQWQNWSDYTATQGLLNVDQSAIVKGVDNRLANLPAAPNGGVTLPATLRPTSFALSMNATTPLGQINGAGGWIDWNILVTKAGNYTVRLSTTGTGGTASLLADDQAFATGASGADLTGTVYLGVGLHTITARSESATAFTVSQVTVVASGVPASPTLSPAVMGDGTAALSWSAAPGALRYRVSYGTAPGVFTGSKLLGNVTQCVVSGLADGQAWFFSVSAVTSQGEGLPSASVGGIPTAAGQVGTLAAWSFDGPSGGGTTSSALATAGQAVVGPLSRGPGLIAASSTWAASARLSRFASLLSKGSYGADLPGAIAAGQYYQFTIGAAAGTDLTLTSLSFRPFFQRYTGGAGITYSTDGVNFSQGINAVGDVSKAGTPWTVDLTGRPNLMGSVATVTVRIYLYGMGRSEVSGLGDPSGPGILVSGGYQPLTSKTTVVTHTIAKPSTISVRPVTTI